MHALSEDPELTVLTLRVSGCGVLLFWAWADGDMVMTMMILTMMTKTTMMRGVDWAR